MTPEEYDAFVDEDRVLPMREVVFENKANRTLLYGYTCDRNEWHVYLMNGIVHCLVYEWRSDPSEVKLISHDKFEPLFESDCESLVPNKRLYPAACDLEFCRILSNLSIYLPFTTFKDRPQEVFYGYTIEDLQSGSDSSGDDLRKREDVLLRPD